MHTFHRYTFAIFFKFVTVRGVVRFFTKTESTQTFLFASYNAGYTWNIHTRIYLVADERGFGEHTDALEEFWNSAPACKVSKLAAEYCSLVDDVFSYVSDYEVRMLKLRPLVRKPQKCCELKSLQLTQLPMSAEYGFKCKVHLRVMRQANNT